MLMFTKKLFLFALLSLGFSFKCLSQYKIIYVQSEERYLRYYYKLSSNDEKIDDSTIYRLTNRGNSCFQLEKIVNNKCKLRKTFSIKYPRKEAITISRIKDMDGKTKSVEQKSYFYECTEIDICK